MKLYDLFENSYGFSVKYIIYLNTLLLIILGYVRLKVYFKCLIYWLKNVVLIEGINIVYTLFKIYKTTIIKYKYMYYIH